MVKLKAKKPNNKVDPKEWYSLSDIVTKKLFTWSTSFWSVRNIVATDKYRANILRAQITGVGRATKYKIQGANIIQFIKLVEQGKVQL